MDIEAGRPTELEPLIGALLDRARARGVATPRLDLVYASLKIHQDQAVRKYAEDETHKQHIADWLRRRPAIAGAGLEGRRAWERALKASSAAAATERVKVEMARGVPKGESRRSFSESLLEADLDSRSPLSLLPLPSQSLELLWLGRRRTTATRRSRSSLASTEQDLPKGSEDVQHRAATQRSSDRSRLSEVRTKSSPSSVRKKGHRALSTPLLLAEGSVSITDASTLAECRGKRWSAAGAASAVPEGRGSGCARVEGQRVPSQEQHRTH